jgi:hypothetical protein
MPTSSIDVQLLLLTSHVLYYSILFYTNYYTMLHCTTLHCTMLCYTALQYTTLHCSILCTYLRLYTGVGPLCVPNCPQGYTDNGLCCLKPAPIGNGVGYAIECTTVTISAQAHCEADNGAGNCFQVLHTVRAVPLVCAHEQLANSVHTHSCLRCM